MIKGADSDGGLSPAAEVEGARRRKMRYTGLVHATRPLRPTLRIIPTRRWPRSATPAPCFRLNAEWRGGGSVCGGVYVGNPASAAATPRDGPGCRAEADGCVQRGAAVGASGGVGHTGPARPAVSDWNTGRTASGLKPAGRGRAERHSGRCTHSQSDTVEKSRVVRDQGCQLGRRPGRRPPPPLPPSSPLCQPRSRRRSGPPARSRQSRMLYPGPRRPWRHTQLIILTRLRRWWRQQWAAHPGGRPLRLAAIGHTSPAPG